MIQRESSTGVESPVRFDSVELKSMHGRISGGADFIWVEFPVGANLMGSNPLRGESRAGSNFHWVGSHGVESHPGRIQ